MPLQNRVDPFGAIHAVHERGLLTGNRGIIHDPETKTLLSKRWTTRAWIICELEFNNRPPRKVLGWNGRTGRAGWTELFFLDEISALAAGHRPCFACRRKRAKEYAGAIAKALGRSSISAPEIDSFLHRERLASSPLPKPEIDWKEVRDLPDGAMISDGASAYAVKQGELLPWTFGGYGDPISYRDAQHADFRLITPLTSVAALRSGYVPVWHPSAAVGQSA